MSTTNGRTARYARTRRATLHRRRAAAALAAVAASSAAGPTIPAVVAGLATGPAGGDLAVAPPAGVYGPVDLALSAVAVLAILIAVVVFTSSRAELGRLAAGIGAERQVARAAARWARPRQATVHNGVALPAGGDADHLILGGGIAAVVETKYGTGPLQFSGGRATGANGKVLHRNPVDQACKAARALTGTLKVTVRPVVCVAPARFAPYQHNGTWICTAQTLGDVLDRLHDQQLTSAAAGRAAGHVTLAT